MRRAIRSAIAAALVLGLLTFAPAGAAVPSRYVQTSHTAAAWAARHGLSSGVAVLDTRTGRIYSAGRDHRRFASASVVKTMIATRLLLTGQLHGRVKAQAWQMITRSDNAAANALYPKVGRDHLLPWLERHYRLDAIGAPPTMVHIWGSTQVTARGLVRFYNAVRHDPKVWPWLGRAMHAYRPTSATGEPNAFGIAAVQPRSAVKNGWDTNRDVRHPGNAIINSTGFVGGDRYAVAILAEGAGSLYYRAGERLVTHEAQLLLHRPAAKAAHAATTWRATVVLDPGHDGGNGAHPSTINRSVYAGYGRHKPCNTTGTATNSGYPEHAFTWSVAKRVRAILLAHHVRVIMTRTSDSGVGPCVNTRARIESRHGVDAAVAIHADGAPSGDHGFHLCVDSRRPEHASKATVARTARLNAALKKSLTRHSRLSVARYIGRNGYYRRDDLAGLNLSTNPTAFLEIGNMRNGGDAAKQRLSTGRSRIASAVASGILTYLFG